MKLGGLFSGIGGFELAWTRLGGEVAWMCEVDPKARKVLEARFPGVPIYPDVQELDPAEVEAVDVLTGGSPCQGFSVAGQRQGLLHGESRLFADYVRIMDGLAERGLQYALWENVPGVLSIKNPDGERTFPHVIGALAGGSTAVRLDPRRKWNVGLVADGGRAVSWRVLDSRYFGVAQRRRRVFACVAFGDSAADRAGRALLAVGEGVRGDSAEGVEEGEGAAGGVAGRAGGSGIPDAVGSLTTQMQGMSGWAPFNETAHLVPDRAGIPSVTGPWWDGGDTADALTRTSDDQRMPDKQRFQAVIDVTGAVTAKWAKGTGGPSGDEAQNLVNDTPKAFNLMPESKQGKWLTANETELSMSLPTTYPADRGVQVINPQQQYGVRRLTPVECERLQAFPDGWTEPAGSDSARYKALGNAVTVNTVGWILRRVLRVEGIPTVLTNDASYGSNVHAAAMLNFQGSKGNSVTNDGEESFALNAMHGHDVHVVAVDVP